MTVSPSREEAIQADVAELRAAAKMYRHNGLRFAAELMFDKSADSLAYLLAESAAKQARIDKALALLDGGIQEEAKPYDILRVVEAALTDEGKTE